MPFELIVQILISVFIFLAMLCVGLAATIGEIVAVLRDRRKTARALLGNIVIAPLCALVLIALIPMPDAAASVLLLLAFAPGGINAIQFSTKVPGQIAAAAALLFLMSVLAVIIAPVAASFVLNTDEAIGVPYRRIFSRAALLILLPLAAGMVIRSHAEGFSEKIYKPAMLVSTFSFIASVLMSMSLRQDSLGDLGTGTTAAMLLFVVVMMTAGWALGGPEQEHRQVLAVSTNLRNVGLVYVIVDNCCGDPLLPAAVLAFMALMVPPNLVFTVFQAIRRKQHAG